MDGFQTTSNDFDEFFWLEPCSEDFNNSLSRIEDCAELNSLDPAEFAANSVAGRNPAETFIESATLDHSGYFPLAEGLALHCNDVNAQGAGRSNQMRRKRRISSSSPDPITRQVVAGGEKFSDAYLGSGSQTDDSWTAEDDMEHWQLALQERLQAFQASQHHWCFIVDPLQSRCRRLVHAAAHIKHLSHMSLGRGKTKRILISKCAIHTSSRTQRLWNPSATSTHIFTMDPHIVVYRSLSLATFEGLTLALEYELSTAGIKKPTQYMREPTKDIIIRPGTEIRVLFEDPTEAAAAVSFMPDQLEYVFFYSDIKKIGAAHPVSDPLHSGEIIPNFRGLGTSCVRFSTTSALPQNDDSSVQLGADWWGGHEDVARGLGPIQPNFPTPSSTRYSRHGTPNPAPAQSGYASSASNGSQVSIASSTYGSTGIGPKRKRNPPGYYRCSFERCGKIFTRAGECTKHEKAHQKELWEYKCPECGHPFRYPKDLRRHCSNTGHPFPENPPPSSPDSLVVD